MGFLAVTINERVPGVPLTAAVVPTAPVLAPQSGTNRLQVQYSLASGDTPQEFVELRVEADGDNDQFWFFDVNWGDGSPLERFSPLGKHFVQFPTHVYTGAGPYTISVEVVFRKVDITFNDSLQITPNLSGDWAVQQVQLEKLEDDVLRYGPDWRSIEEVPTSFVDSRVVQGYAYKYRVRFRTTNRRGAAVVTSQYSPQTYQAPW